MRSRGPAASNTITVDAALLRPFRMHLIRSSYCQRRLNALHELAVQIDGLYVKCMLFQWELYIKTSGCPQLPLREM